MTKPTTVIFVILHRHDHDESFLQLTIPAKYCTKYCLTIARRKNEHTQQSCRSNMHIHE